ncbi:MAG TPA: hypothetical protein VM891_06140 [Amaricoccus sp.]|nr:hypothetical protein [Amaricoccus sp.]
MPELGPVATPTDELDARRNWTGPTLAGGVLTADMAAFCQCGVGIAVASRGADGWPVLARGRGCRIDAGGLVRVILRRDAAAALLEAIAEGRPVAATFSQPGTHRSIQLKAAGARVREAVPEDARAADAQSAVFRDLLIAAAYPGAFATTYSSAGGQAAIAIEFVPESAFVQTPGPGAGSRLEP